ncbi:MAG TPA: septal ring lytic transglycosylase RlpA family protein [Bryobacteraceae bacterium]|nr:septal ring lytic transglycosylase RlpA family protein [Bryobacteraceae bacterium]
MSNPSHRYAIAAVIIVLSILLTTGCGKKKMKIAKPPSIGHTETGIASWYGHPYHGRRAANGEVYDMEKLTAAHRTYPFDTWVRVQNLSNDRTVDVRIQDRGPFIDGRIIDLSHAAAREIELIGPGVAKVKLTVIAPPKDFHKEPELFGIQVGSFRDQNRALTLRDEMKARFGTARVIERGADPPMFRVVAGEYESATEAELAAEPIRQSGGAALVVRIDEPPQP